MARSPGSILAAVLFLLALAPGLRSPAAELAPDAPASALEPVAAEVARWAVAIRVDREDEPPALSRVPVRSGMRLPKDVVDYYKRPPGPATGLLLDSQGNILTTQYNVAGKIKSIEAVLPGGEVRPAKLIAVDKSDDLALIRIIDPPPDLSVPPVKWADPARLAVGRVVLVVGRSPDPARPTATFGIVSALGRNGGRAFQTDAELNYGNVGGPVADLEGSIVGLAGFVGHTYTLWGLNSGIGFATRVDTILSVLPALLRGENVPPPERPFLGVGMSEHPPEGGAGVRIGRVESGSAAAGAGIKPDDVILSIDGEKLEDFMDLRRIVNRHKPGEEVTLRVKRGESEFEVKVPLGKRPD